MKDYNKLAETVIQTEKDNMIVAKLVTLKTKIQNHENEIRGLNSELHEILMDPEAFASRTRSNNGDGSYTMRNESSNGNHSHTLPNHTHSLN